MVNILFLTTHPNCSRGVLDPVRAVASGGVRSLDQG